MRQFRCVSTTYAAEYKETIFLNISNCKSVLKYLSLYHKLFIFASKLDLMNYLFANLAVLVVVNLKLFILCRHTASFKM